MLIRYIGDLLNYKNEGKFCDHFISYRLTLGIDNAREFQKQRYSDIDNFIEDYDE